MTVDTTQPFTVVTQFITNDNTATGTLSQINRIYVQNGKVIQNSFTDIAGISPAVNAISDNFCNQQKTAVGDINSFEQRGDWKTAGTALEKGMVLALSLWDDYAANMLWLDSDYPLDASASPLGVARGTWYKANSGVPVTVEANAAKRPGGHLQHQDRTHRLDLRQHHWSPTSPSGTVTPSSATGGEEYTGPTVCVAPFTCQVQNPFFSPVSVNESSYRVWRRDAPS
ncbi:Glucanase [Mycena sanguinolenta]|uniref:Glucanase n=1 Tax=Mycena sanguinolenta TaxID=230812 RepID=A0A8H6TUJ8_9AGAR|nr:Glucanase [Mycena sanguinolenta]